MATTTCSEATEPEGTTAIFDMGSLSVHLPKKRRGLSNYFSGKSRSFASLAEAKRVEDLKKEEIPEAKRRKYMDRQEAVAFLPSLLCRDEPSKSLYCRSCVGA